MAAIDTGDGALVQLRAYIAQSDLNPNERLPSERRLCDVLGVSRAELRKAFAVLEAEGAIWRHVGRGTFVSDGSSMSLAPSISAIAKRTTPREVNQARLLLEPMIASMAADNATQEHMEALKSTTSKTKLATTWREYETLDNHFHRLLA
ncbi:MAG: FadR/GntR family transcriptional regulator, partial [Halocynthiibacter sp.]